MKSRTTILGLMGLVLLMALGFAALRSASLLWASAMFTTAVIVLSASVLGVFANRGPSRLPWLGFATFGWIYFLMTFWLWPDKNGMNAPPVLPKLVMDYFMPKPDDDAVARIGDIGYDETFPNEPQAFNRRGNPFAGRIFNVQQFRRIDHSLTAILFGVVGALLGRSFAAPNGSAETPIPG